MTTHHPAVPRRAQGSTLIEMMIAVAILGIALGTAGTAATQDRLAGQHVLAQERAAQAARVPRHLPGPGHRGGPGGERRADRGASRRQRAQGPGAISGVFCFASLFSYRPFNEITLIYTGIYISIFAGYQVFFSSFAFIRIRACVWIWHTLPSVSFITLPISFMVSSSQ